MQVQHENTPSTGKVLRDAWLKSKNLSRLIEKAKATGNGGIITTCAAPDDGFVKDVVPGIQFETQIIDTSQLSFSSLDIFNGMNNADVVILDTREQSDTKILDALRNVLKSESITESPFSENTVFIIVATSHNDYIARKLHA